jgi:hypothetical protein
MYKSDVVVPPPPVSDSRYTPSASTGKFVETTVALADVTANTVPPRVTVGLLHGVLQKPLPLMFRPFGVPAAE